LNSYLELKNFREKYRGPAEEKAFFFGGAGRLLIGQAKNVFRLKTAAV
jgi:hypothetical protein